MDTLRDASRTIFPLQVKTDAKWWIDSQNKTIEAIFDELYLEGHDLENGYLHC